jgi:hypothetical protein
LSVIFQIVAVTVLSCGVIRGLVFFKGLHELKRCLLSNMMFLSHIKHVLIIRSFVCLSFSDSVRRNQAACLNLNLELRIYLM